MTTGALAGTAALARKAQIAMAAIIRSSTAVGIWLFSQEVCLADMFASRELFQEMDGLNTT